MAGLDGNAGSGSFRCSTRSILRHGVRILWDLCDGGSTMDFTSINKVF